MIISVRLHDAAVWLYDTEVWLHDAVVRLYDAAVMILREYNKKLTKLVTLKNFYI